MPKKKDAAPKEFPDKITCSVCKAEKGMSPDRWEKGIKQFGSIEELKKKYKCRACRPPEERRVNRKAKSSAAKASEGPETLYPTKITCSKCKVEKGMSPDRWEKYIKLYGNIEKLKEGYICRGCRSTTKDPKAPKLPRVKKMTVAGKKPFKHDDDDKPIYHTPTTMTASAQKVYGPFSNDGKLCLRIDLFRAQGGCNNCPWYDICECKQRKLVPGVAFPWKDGEMGLDVIHLGPGGGTEPKKEVVGKKNVPHKK